MTAGFLSPSARFEGRCNASFGGSDSPVDVVVRKLDGVRGTPPKCRATCPACRRKGALSVSEGRDHQALLRCFAGCELETIAGAIGLSVSDLFAGDEARRERARSRFAARRHFANAPRRTVHEALDRGLAETRRRLSVELGYDRPLRSSDLNGIRERVCRMLDLDPSTLPPLEPFPWECAPHDNDPNWPALYMRALEEETRRRCTALRPEALPWEIDPEPGFYDRIRAEQLAREWQRRMAS